MAGILASAITSLCVTTPGAYSTACNKALDAGTQQSGIRKEADAIEDANLRKLNSQAFETFGETGTKAVSGAVFVVAAFSNRKVTVNLPNGGLCDSLNTVLTPSQYFIKFSWKF